MQKNFLNLQDGIYTNERGPGPDGKLQRTNLLVASADVLSGDLVGAKIFGIAHDNWVDLGNQSSIQLINPINLPLYFEVLAGLVPF